MSVSPRNIRASKTSRLTYLFLKRKEEGKTDDPILDPAYIYVERDDEREALEVLGVRLRG